MVGGRVTETLILDDKVWINCRDTTYGDECAIYVERTPEALTVSPGDCVWWQGRTAFWTPTADERLDGTDFLGPEDVRIPRVGYSGVNRPAPLTPALP